MGEGDIARAGPGLDEMAGNQTRPELVVGILAAAGTPIDRVEASLAAALEFSGYKPETLHLSRYTEQFELSNPAAPPNANYVDYLEASMNLGSEAREKTGRDDVLALAAIADIHYTRNSGEK